MNILHTLLRWKQQRQKRLQTETRQIAHVKTFSGTSLPGKRIVRILGSISTHNSGYKELVDLQNTLKLHAYEMGANYIINYKEENSLTGMIYCRGDAVLAEDE